MPSGTAVLNFGVFPGASDASVAVTGQSMIAAGSLVEAWIFPVATPDHSADEHLVSGIQVIAGSIVVGVGFTIFGFCQNQATVQDRPFQKVGLSRNAPTLYGQWTVAWCWN